MPLEVGIEFGSGTPDQMELLLLDQRHQSFKIHAEQRPVRLMLDPNTWVLMEAEFRER